MRRVIWFCLGIMFLGIAWLGVFVPGLPWSTPAVIAAYCFAKSNKTWHEWLMNHKLFGQFLREWDQHKVFPRRAKYAMVISMVMSMIILILTVSNGWVVLGIGLCMVTCMIWAFRFPHSVEQAEQRLARGEPLGWFK